MNIIKNYLASLRDPKNPTAKLTLISFTLILTSALILGIFVSYYLASQTKKHHADTTTHFIRSYVDEQAALTSLKDKGALTPGEASKAALLKMKGAFGLKGVKVLDPGGGIIWSDGESGEDLLKVSVPIESAADSGSVKAIVDVYMSPLITSGGAMLGWVIIILIVLTGGVLIHLILARTIKRSYQQNMIMQYEIVEYSKELESNIHMINDVQNAAILGLSQLAEYRDKETGEHLERMSRYSRILTEELSTWDKFKFYISSGYVDAIFISAVLHDIGKVAIPDRVLLKPGKFTDEEWAVMKTHTTIGGNALKAASEKLGFESFLTMGRDIAYYHHENFNGKGYPHGLNGEDIPLSARIVAFADAYDAITSKRVYKEAQDFEVAKEQLERSSGVRYDPDMFKAFLNIEDKFIKVAKEYQG